MWRSVRDECDSDLAPSGPNGIAATTEVRESRGTTFWRDARCRLKLPVVQDVAPASDRKSALMPDRDIISPHAVQPAIAPPGYWCDRPGAVIFQARSGRS